MKNKLTSAGYRYLSHFTHPSNIDAIMKEGIMPRSITCIPSTSDEYPSMPEYVYLTNDPIGRMNCEDAPNRATLVLVDSSYLDTSLLYPDEDYLAAFAIGDEIDSEDYAWEDYLRVKTEKYKRLALRSLRDFGSIAYRGVIPAVALRPLFSLWQRCKHSARCWCDIPLSQAIRFKGMNTSV